MRMVSDLSLESQGCCRPYVPRLGPATPSRLARHILSQDSSLGAHKLPSPSLCQMLFCLTARREKKNGGGKKTFHGGKRPTGTMASPWPISSSGSSSSSHRLFFLTPHVLGQHALPTPDGSLALVPLCAVCPLTSLS